jgi:hypothetical protein
VAFVVHPEVWSSSTFNGGSAMSAGRTSILRLSAVFHDCIFSGNQVSTHTISGRPACCFVFPVYFRVFHVHVVSSTLLQERVPVLQDLM